MKPKSSSTPSWTESKLSQPHHHQLGFHQDSRKSSSTHQLQLQTHRSSESHGYHQDPIRKPSTTTAQLHTQLSQLHGNQLQVGVREPRPNDTPESRYQTAENTPNLQPHNSDHQQQQQHRQHQQQHRQLQQYYQQQVSVPADATASLKRDNQKVRALELGFRLSEMVLCLVSFSVMATDKTQGWSGDSFDRYKEYRYCVSVNVIGFVYSGFQACDMAYRLIMAYVLISASSSAATRVIDWESNWGRDEFTEKASASIAMAFLAFISFAFSSLFSLFNLPTFSHH
ncbi:CASP-like protein 4A3 [Senna tora]|uniref:CASP-like protein n=1 Tax=Senna tora TaxID=362788 RepID=A0A834X5J8_9FABA|nr:CASP-like protein 4A3 [Senna tora]